MYISKAIKQLLKYIQRQMVERTQEPVDTKSKSIIVENDEDSTSDVDEISLSSSKRKSVSIHPGNEPIPPRRQLTVKSQESCSAGLTGFAVTGVAMFVLIVIAWFIIMQMDFLLHLFTEISEAIFSTIGYIQYRKGLPAEELDTTYYSTI
ncbi:uncharacterized protein LOC115633909 [Scaptodrosophila lebanonensis]|uniref:Uncharacterized protein LOC115633909 n=1 Tax=Drosophila lebanonensis TaxID=7225 RepID=A0A6J2UJ86_DROLE|nr:uncharacterized protein LOC115633909 [Scaptodrosophila lebanonensis]